jgi:hypothetical protein
MPTRSPVVRAVNNGLGGLVINWLRTSFSGVIRSGGGTGSVYNGRGSRRSALEATAPAPTPAATANTRNEAPPTAARVRMEVLARKKVSSTNNAADAAAGWRCVPC